jgi:hypothetical protein
VAAKLLKLKLIFITLIGFIPKIITQTVFS